MDTRLPPPPNTVYESALSYNALPPVGRAVMDLAARGEDRDSHRIPEIYDSSDLCDEVAMKRLETEGHIAPLPKFADKVAEAHDHPEQFTHYFSYNFSALMCPITEKYYTTLATTPLLNEGQALAELDDFLTTVKETAGANDDEAVADQVDVMREELGYLDEADLSRGIDALSTYWARILDEDPERVINLFQRPHRYKKSFEFTQERLLATLGATRPELLDRINLDPETWDKTENSMLVILDDWVISGDSISKKLVEFINQADELGVPTEDVEVHSVVADSRLSKFPGVTYRSVFFHEAEIPDQDTGAEGAEEVQLASMLGSHAAVNYGFTWVLRDMNRYLESVGIFTGIPIVANPEPTDYRTMSTDFAKRANDPELISQTVNENVEALKLLTLISGLERAVFEAKVGDGTETHQTDPETQAKIDQIVELRVRLRQMSEKRDAKRKELGLKANTI